MPGRSSGNVVGAVGETDDVPGLAAFGVGVGGAPGRVVSSPGVVDVPGAAVFDGGAAVFAPGVDGVPGLVALAAGADDAFGTVGAMLGAGVVPGLVERTAGAGAAGLTPFGPGAGGTVWAPTAEAASMPIDATSAMVFRCLTFMRVSSVASGMRSARAAFVPSKA